jgi:hypothetical protein
MPHASEPHPNELAEMSQRARQVVKLLEDFKRLNGGIPLHLPPNVLPGGLQQQPSQQPTTIHQAPISPDDVRPPKRPWEDMSQDHTPADEQQNYLVASNDIKKPISASTSNDGGPSPTPTPSLAPATTAEQDMEMIRTKRATTTAQAAASSSAGANAGSGGATLKSKYRKRSVSSTLLPVCGSYLS